MPTKPVCNHCQSEAVKLDAFAVWDKSKTDWALESTFDNAWCDDCDGECSLDWVTEPEPCDS